ncbi:hypothetical protein HKX48_000898 [Thoreauomyces humboldtii]|nr:hypothetical protein HKX48_000898 [Thoreauomyces humboldtii]
MLAGPPKTPLRRTLAGHATGASSGSPSPATPLHLRGIPDPDSERRTQAIRRRKSIVDDHRKRRQSFAASGSGGSSAASSPAQLNRRAGGVSLAPGTPARPKLSDAEIRSSFDEWMKIAADNKINSSNSWNLALIDYFQDLTLLRDGADNSINFQKASCTLDGCVKIYTSRVDSVDSETKKLLSGLVDSRGRGQAGDDEQGDDENEDGAAAAKPARRKAHRSVNTLEKDINSLNVKTLDLEFTVDPLFKKTSADFDEGGAHGLLLNHLAVSDKGQIVFDAGDSGAIGDHDVEAEKEIVGDQVVDLTRLKACFGSALSRIWSMEVCPSLSKFTFTDGSTDTSSLFAQRPSIYDDILPSHTEDDPFADSDNDDGGEGGAEMYGENVGYSADASIMVGEGGNVADDGDLFAYFDATAMKSWAGPEHWRARAIPAGKKAATQPKKRTTAPTLDFTSPLPDLEALFAPATVSTTLPRMHSHSTITHLLPDDMHFSSKDLLRLFLKPRYRIKFWRRGDQSGEAIKVPHDGPLDDEFWASHETQPAGDSIEEHNPPHFSDSEVEDDEDDPSVSQTHDQNGETLDFGDQLVDQPRNVRTQHLRYARVAKKVDVKRLKLELWRGFVGRDQTDREEEDAPVPPSKTPTSFKSLITTLDDAYAEDPKKRKDISVAFCFICVLHLANEKNLKIEQAGGMGVQGLKDLSILQGA